MQHILISLIIFILLFIIQVVIILKRKNSNLIPLKLFIAFIISVIVSLALYFAFVIIYLGTDLSI